MRLHVRHALAVSAVFGVLALGLWSTPRHQAVAQVRQPVAAVQQPSSQPTVGQVAAVEQPAPTQEETRIATLDDIAGVVVHVYRVAGQIIAVSNFGSVAMQQDLTPPAATSTETTVQR